MPEVFNRVKAGMEDTLDSDATSTVTQTRDGPLLGQSKAVTPVNTRFLRLDAALKAAVAAWSGMTYLYEALVSLAAAVVDASASVKGVTKLSVAPAVSTNPISVGDNDPRMSRILSAAQYASAGLIVSQSISLAHVAGTDNGYVTDNYLRDQHASLWGTGKDGEFKTGAIVDPAIVPTLATSTTGGTIPAATYSVKVTFGNVTGETTASSASATVTTTGSTSTITLTNIPTGGANTAWRKIYLDNGASSWKLALYIPDNSTTEFVLTSAVTGSTTAPGANTTAASWTSNVAGEYHFRGAVTLPALTLTGDLIIRATGIVTVSGAITGTGVGNGNGVLKGFTGIYVGGSYTTQAPASGGFGSNYRAIEMPGAGSDGASAAGGLPGAVLIVYAHGINIGASATLNGANGANSAVATGGGGGAGGIMAAIARDYVISGTHTVTTNGGNGGNSTGTSATAGPGAGGGGFFIAVAPIVDVANLTHTKNAGSDGTGGSGGARYGIGAGGSCAGDGTAFNALTGIDPTKCRSATAGQTVILRQQPFNLRIA